MNDKLTPYQEKVLMNAFDGKTIDQIHGDGGVLQEEWYMYPVRDKAYALPRSRHGCHTINKFAFKKLLRLQLLEPIDSDSFSISRKGMEQILGHSDFKVYNDKNEEIKVKRVG